MNKNNKNIYMGSDSTAKIPVTDKVDTDYEILLNIFSTGYDALNNIMLTKKPGVFNKTNLSEVNSRFGILRMLSSRYSSKMLPVIDEMYGIIQSNYNGLIPDSQALLLMRDICIRYNLNTSLLDQAIMRINNAEMIRAQHHKPNNGFNEMFPFWIQPQNNKNCDKKRISYRRRFL